MSQEPLVYVPLEKWSELLTVFKADWPRSISGYTVLQTQRIFIEKGLDYGFKVYCPFGDVRNGMVAFNKKDRYNEIIIQYPQDNIDQLENALRNTQLINWQKRIIIPFVTYNVIETLQRVLGHDKIDLLPLDTFLYDKPVPFEDAILPSGVSFGLVSSKYLDLVNQTWPYCYSTSRWYFELLINMEFGYGLFEDNELVSWVFLNESGALLHLFTPEKHRRRGYAELLLKLVSNILVKEGKPVLAFCVKGNTNAYKLYEKLAFDKTYPIAWCYINRPK